MTATLLRLVGGPFDHTEGQLVPAGDDLVHHSGSFVYCWFGGDLHKWAAAAPSSRWAEQDIVVRRYDYVGFATHAEMVPQPVANDPGHQER